jgi:hypothetical protein
VAPLGCAVIRSVVLVGGTVGAVVAVGATVAVGVGVALGVGVGDELGLGEALGLGEGLAAAALVVTLAEQMTRPPPPLAEPLHWLIVTIRAADSVPVAVQVRPTRVPPLAEPLHCVIVAPVVVAGNGLQPVVMPPPEPTHWLTETVVEPALRPMNSFEIWALQRSVPPAPLMELLHCVTAVTGVVSTFVVVEQAKPPVPLPSVGAPAEPRHSRTVTVAVPVSGSVPAAEVILLTTVTSQIRP